MFSVIIVTWNNEDVIENCIKSLVRYEKNIEIIVVDSKSSDKTIEKINILSLDNIRVIPLKENVGFAKGNNIGAELARYDNLVLLNPDTVILESGFNKLLKHLESKKIGILGPKLLNSDYSLQPSAFNFDTPINILLEQFMIGNVFSEKLKKKYTPYLSLHDSIMEVDWVIGAFMLLKKQLFIEVGGFSETYFLYSEDMDLCYKVKQKGFETEYYSEYSIIHIGGTSESKDNQSKKSTKLLVSKIQFAKLNNKNMNKSTLIFSYFIKRIIYGVCSLIKMEYKHKYEYANENYIFLKKIEEDEL